MDHAIFRLSSGKAAGIDKLRDIHLKFLLKTSPRVKFKIQVLILKWLNGGDIPYYFTHAKTFLLSKEQNQFPKVGNVRIIAVLPAILKLYEQILLLNLRRELQRTTPLHENQRGFIEGKCTMHNIKDIVDQINHCKLSIKKDIDKKLSVDKRCTHYLLFIDISKAFDSINRNKLLNMMADRGFNGLLIKAFEKLFADTRMVINDEKVYTNKGVM